MRGCESKQWRLVIYAVPALVERVFANHDNL